MLARVLSLSLLALAGLALVPPLGGCGRALEPANRPIDTCVLHCTTRASRQCSEAECQRGCEFILDRLIEKEGDNVIACIAKSSRRCGDVVWADCATLIGVHADGGPPPPAGPIEEE